MTTTRSILMVEDELLLREIVVEALQDAGYEVSVAKDGREALEILHGDKPLDILFSDVSMPNGVSGVDLAARARDLRPGLRIVLTSGFAKGQIPTLPPHVAFLQKPYRIRQLFDVLEQPDPETAPR